MVLDPIPNLSPYIFLGLDPSPPPLAQKQQQQQGWHRSPHDTRGAAAKNAFTCSKYYAPRSYYSLGLGSMIDWCFFQYFVRISSFDGSSMYNYVSCQILISTSWNRTSWCTSRLHEMWKPSGCCQRRSSATCARRSHYASHFLNSFIDDNWISRDGIFLYSLVSMCYCIDIFSYFGCLFRTPPPLVPELSQRSPQCRQAESLLEKCAYSLFVLRRWYSWWRPTTWITVFGKHCECIAQKCTHLERLPPLASDLLLLSHCVLTRHGGQKSNTVCCRRASNLNLTDFKLNALPTIPTEQSYPMCHTVSTCE